MAEAGDFVAMGALTQCVFLTGAGGKGSTHRPS